MRAALLCFSLASLASAAPLRVGSKAFTESVILGELAAQLSQPSEHRRALGGTRILFDALLAGQIDVYPEYTGTLTQELVPGATGERLEAELARRGLKMTAPLGFANTYAIGMKEERAQALGIRTLSDLARHPELKLGFSNEFINRGDGWPALRSAYSLPQGDVRGLDHDLAYRALASGAIDATDLYSTDADIRLYGLRVLEDDRHHFPDYRAVFLYRADLEEKNPSAVEQLSRLEGRISDADMIAMNARAKVDRVREPEVAAEFLEHHLNVKSERAQPGLATRLWRRTLEHLWLVGISLAGAIALALPLGILAARRRRVGQGLLAAVGVIQTIPALALLVFMIPLLGIGAKPAIAALFLYSLLPIVRNTYSGLCGIAPELREAADALGLGGGARLRWIDLPLAGPSILAGIKTAAVINVGTATIGALIGAGGYGQSILTGIRLADTRLIFEGAVPAAALALLTQGAFELAERWLVPRGLRLGR